MGSGADDFERTYHDTKLRLARTAALITGSHDAALDIVADTFAKVLPRWRAGRVDDLAGYLHRSVVNASISWHRRRRVVVAARPPAHDHADRIAEHALVWTALGELKPRTRAMLVLRFFDDLTEAQTAAALGVPVGTVKSTVSRALDELRAALSKGELT